MPSQWFRGAGISSTKSLGQLQLITYARAFFGQASFMFLCNQTSQWERIRRLYVFQSQRDVWIIGINLG